MRRRDLFALAGGAALAWPLAARAAKPMPVICYLSSSSPSPSASFVAVFKKGLSEAGYAEGQNVAIEYRWAESHYDRLPILAADLVGRKVDLIVTTGGAVSALAAKTQPRRFRSSSSPARTPLPTAWSPVSPDRAVTSVVSVA